MLKINKKSIILFSIYFLVGFLLNINSAQAAEINFSPSSSKYYVGDTIKIKVLISSDKSINAVSSKIFFPPDLMSVTSLSKTSSIINLWAQEPVYSNNDGFINFEGVSLNGYIGNSGNIITLVFKAKKTGQAKIEFKIVNILANDGNGTDIFSGNLTSSIINIEKPIKVEKTIEDVVSEPKTEVIENVVEKIGQVEITNQLPNNSLLVTIIVLLLILLVLLIISIFYLLSKLRKKYQSKLYKVENVVYKNFNNLEIKMNSHSKKQDSLSNSGIIDKDKNKKDSLLKDVIKTEESIIKDIEDLKD